MMVAGTNSSEVGLERIIVSTYQAVSGAGMGAILETQAQLRAVLNDGVGQKLLKQTFFLLVVIRNITQLDSMHFLKLTSSLKMTILTKR